MNAYLEEDLSILSTDFRLVFQVILWPLIIIGMIANVTVVFCICFTSRNNSSSSLKPFYRASLVSLALSDLLLLGSSGSNILALISSNTMTWKLSNIACQLTPYLQTVSMLVASLNLAAVALDRYTAIQAKHPLQNPRNFVAIGSTIIIWSIAAASSYPVLELYKTEMVVIINNTTMDTHKTEALCVTDRHAAATVYTALFAVIFVPLATVFILVYILLALSIHRRKSPGESRRNQPQISQDNSTASTGTTTKSVKWTKKTPTPIHIIRKRRTVRVILILIGIFSICRLPQWIFLLIKLHIKLYGKFWWHLQVVLTSLSLLNATIHPFCYAFLNEALSLVSWIYSLCCARKKSMTVSQESKEVKEGSFSASVKVPRGPYSP